jgi:hypothetical protein
MLGNTVNRFMEGEQPLVYFVVKPRGLTRAVYGVTDRMQTIQSLYKQIYGNRIYLEATKLFQILLKERRCVPKTKNEEALIVHFSTFLRQIENIEIHDNQDIVCNDLQTIFKCSRKKRLPDAVLSHILSFAGRRHMKVKFHNGTERFVLLF